MGYNMTDATRNIAECVGLPALSSDMKSVRVTTATFNIKWQNILDKLQVGLTPYAALVESLCGGKLLQKCFACSEEMTVADVKVEMYGNEVEGQSWCSATLSSVCVGRPCAINQGNISRLRRK